MPLLVALRLLAVMLAHAQAEAAGTAEVLAHGLAAEVSGHPVLRLHMYTPLCDGTEATCGWPGGKTMDIAVQLMLGYINVGGYLRGNWTLDVNVIDTACSLGKGRDEATRLLLLPREQWPFAVIGCGCTGCTTAVQPLLNLARMPQISHSSTSPSLSDRERFPNFFRLAIPDHEGLRSVLVLFLGLNWTTHAQLYDTAFGEFLVPFVSQTAEDLGMVNVLSGRSVAKMRKASPAHAQPIVEALVQARTRAILYMGYATSAWYLGCAMFKRHVRGMIVAHVGWYLSEWWRMQPDPSLCTPAEMDVAVNHWIAPRDPMFTEFGAEVECLPPGVTLQTFVEAYEKQRDELGLDDIIASGAAADSVCFLAKIFNTLLDRGFGAGEVHNMNESTYATYSALAQGMSMMGTSGPVSFPSDPTAFGAGDRINIFWVDQLQGAAYRRVAKIDGQSITFAGWESTMSFFGSHSLAKPPAALFPACQQGIYNFLNESCEGCPSGSDFVDTRGSCFCSPGYQVNGTECSPCAEGSYSASFGSEACELCDQGTFAQSRGQTSCERCPLGTFMPRTGGATCESCGLRRTTPERGAVAAEQCICRQGSFLRSNTESCEACPEGLLCAPGLDPPQQQPGFWAELRKPTHEHVVWRCRNSHECNGGAVGDCAAGRQGRCCNDCLSLHRPLDNGTCQPCDSWNLVPAVITAVVVLAVLVALLVLVRVDASKENLELVGTSIVATQVCMVLQMLSAFVQIDVQWVNPAKAIVEHTKFLSLDLDILNGNCWLPSADPVSKFAFQLLAPPCWACAVLFAWGLSQCTRRPLSYNKVFSLLGTVLVMLFIALTLTVLLPFQCQNNPSGRLSMAAHPGMVCFESAEHWTLVAMATAGFAVYPATCLTWASWATMKYPAWILSGCGLSLLRKYRFLFGRFKPDHYYFGLCMLYRNCLIALVPIVLVSAEAAQIILLCVVLVGSGLFVAHTWPWRSHLANHADVLMLFSTSLLLTGMATLVQITEGREPGFGWLLAVLTALPLGCGLTFVVWGIGRNARRRLHYEIFLSHHKAGAGVLARLLKLELAKVGVCKAFLDVDSLENLDTLFHIVRMQTRNMVVLLSSETLKRMWCAGEIVTAYMNNVRTVPVLCDGFSHPDELGLAAIAGVWTSAELQALNALGISWDMTKAAYHWLRQLPSVELRRFCSEAEHGRNVHNIINLCRHTKAAPQPKLSAVSRPEILVTGAISDPEGLAACQVFRSMLQQATRVEAAVVRTRLELQQVRSSARFLVVLLARDVLLDERFAEIMVAAHKGRNSLARAKQPGRRSSRVSLSFVTVTADTGFKFPPHDFYDRLRQKRFGGKDTESVISAYQALLRVLALPFSALGSVNLLQTEVSEICRRRFGGLDTHRRSTTSKKQAKLFRTEFFRVFTLDRLGAHRQEEDKQEEEDEEDHDEDQDEHQDDDEDDDQDEDQDEDQQAFTLGRLGVHGMKEMKEEEEDREFQDEHQDEDQQKHQDKDQDGNQQDWRCHSLLSCLN